MTRRRIGALGAAVLLAGTAGVGLAQQRNLLVLGGGSTFVAPLVQAWIDEFTHQHGDVDVAYDVIGSAEGLNRFVTGSLDFVASDVPLDEKGAAAAGPGVVQVPVALGMVAVTYNLPNDPDGRLRLPRNLLGDIFAGGITRWDDPRLVEANPEMELPSRPIYLVARGDASGTTLAFTAHLASASESWRATGQGATSLANWPAGTVRELGNEGVAKAVLRGEGTIGYVEAGLAERLGLEVALVENAAGAFVAPSVEAGAAAVTELSLAEIGDVALADPQAADAYPIVNLTWLLVRTVNPRPDKADAVRRFAAWTLTDGQAIAPELGYVPLPDEVAGHGLNVVLGLK